MMEDMMEEHPHGNATHRVNEANHANNADVAFEPMEPPARDLANDGAQWRVQHVATVTEIDQRLRAALRAWLGEPGETRQAVQSDGPMADAEEEHKVDQQVRGGNWPREEGRNADIGIARAQAFRTSVRRGALHGRRRMVAALAGIAAVFVVAVGTVIAVAGQQHAPVSMAPPRLYIWSSQAAFGSRTPQEAFAAGIKWTPCLGTSTEGTTGQGTPARTVTVTWLATTPDYGIALIYSDCAQGRVQRLLSLFTLGKRNNQWTPQAGEDANISPSAKLLPTSPVPPWLPLPQGTYGGRDIGPQGLTPSASVRFWYSRTQAFVAGHIAQRAIRPTGALTVQLAGHMGWEISHAGTVSIVLPLPDGTTYFFAGTGSPAQIEPLAALCFAHSSDLLAPLPHRA